MVETKPGFFPVAFSSDCVGPWGRSRHLVESWRRGMEEHARVSTKSQIKVCEVLSFPGKAKELKPAIDELGLVGGLHGRIGGKVVKGVMKKIFNYGMVNSLADETEILAKLQEPGWVYGLTHGGRFWQLAQAKGVEAIIAELAGAGKMFFIENDDWPGAMDLAVRAVKSANDRYPGQFGLMIDWLHLLKDTGGEERAREKAEAVLEEKKILFGEHGAFGLRKRDSHDLEAIRTDPAKLKALKRLYATGDQFEERLLIRVIETQYEPLDYLRLDFGFSQFISDRNVELVRFLVEDLGWI